MTSENIEETSVLLGYPLKRTETYNDIEVDDQLTLYQMTQVKISLAGHSDVLSDKQGQTDFITETYRPHTFENKTIHFAPCQGRHN